VVDLIPNTECKCSYYLNPKPSKHIWKYQSTLFNIWHNTTHHSTLGTTPFHALYDRPPSTTLDMLHTPRPRTTISELLYQHTPILHTLKHNLCRIRQHMCDQANRHRTDHTFSIDDWVWVRLQRYLQSVEHCPCMKLNPHYLGPYQIICHIKAIAYELRLPTTSRIHLIFHISLNRPFKESKSPNLPNPTS